ncbi:MAG: sigma-70 family RNA polymerase sigma factor, partial [Notoacmeibacter sp.]|nr:sigma-70 family RNA polymerase sigma factor [Notoacmeibacter sp.]
MDEQAGTEEAVPLQDDLSRLLLRVGRDQDDSAFETLFRHYGPRIRAFMRKRCGDATQAEELMQETFANVWRRAGSFDPARGTVSAWIYTVARNTSVDVFRRRN